MFWRALEVLSYALFWQGPDMALVRGLCGWLLVLTILLQANWTVWNRRRPSLWSGINKQGSCRLEGGLGGPWRKILWSVPLQKRFQVSQEYKMKRRDYLLYKSERKSKGECNIWTKSNHWNRLSCNYCNYTHSYFEHDKWLHREPYLPLRLELPHISSILPSHVIIIY